MRGSTLKGTVVPLVTPFSADESFDRRAMDRLIDFVFEQGADALMTTAVTGEGTLLTADETLAVWDAVFDKAAGAVAIVPAVISTTTRAAVELARAAERMGATAVMAAPILPELYTGRSHKDVIGFYSDLAAATSLPLILFNYPSLTGVDFTPALVAELAEIESVSYIKESSGDVRRVHAIQRQLGNRIEVICGAPNVALESLALGCRTWITGLMNVVPRTARQLMRAVHEFDDLNAARRIYYKQLLPLVDLLSRNNKPTATIKAGLGLRGVSVGLPRRPGGPIDRSDLESLERLVTDIIQEEASTEEAFKEAPSSARSDQRRASSNE